MPNSNRSPRSPGTAKSEYEKDMETAELIEQYYVETQPQVQHEIENPPISRSKIRSTSRFCEDEGLPRARFETLWKSTKLDNDRKNNIPFEDVKYRLLAQIEHRRKMRIDKAQNASDARRPRARARSRSNETENNTLSSPSSSNRTSTPRRRRLGDDEIHDEEEEEQARPWQQALAHLNEDASSDNMDSRKQFLEKVLKELDNFKDRLQQKKPVKPYWEPYSMRGSDMKIFIKMFLGYGSGKLNLSKSEKETILRDEICLTKERVDTKQTELEEELERLVVGLIRNDDVAQASDDDDLHSSSASAYFDSTSAGDTSNKAGLKTTGLDEDEGPADSAKGPAEEMDCQDTAGLEDEVDDGGDGDSKEAANKDMKLQDLDVGDSGNADLFATELTLADAADAGGLFPTLHSSGSWY